MAKKITGTTAKEKPTANKTDSKSQPVEGQNEPVADQVESLREENDADLAEAAKEADNPEPVKEQAELVDNSITIVIPYLASAAKADELRYALRAWEANLKNVQIVIIGDLPAFVDESAITYIKHKRFSKNPQIDVADKLKTICESDLVPDYFVLSNDDIYPVNPVTLSYLDIPTAVGFLSERGAAGGVYRENSKRTLKALQKNGIPNPYDHATHTPKLFWKKELLEVLNQYNCTSEGHLVATLYFNEKWTDLIPILIDNGVSTGHAGTQSFVGTVRRKTPDKILARAFATRSFINSTDNGWESVSKFLKIHFKSKSRFEK